MMKKLPVKFLLDNALSLGLLVASAACQILFFVALLVHDANLVERSLTDAFSLRIDSLKPLLNSTVVPLMAGDDHAALEARLGEIRSDEDIVYLVVRDATDAIISAVGWDRAVPLPLASRSILREDGVYDTFLLIETSGKKIGTLNFGVSTAAVAASRDALLARGSIILAGGILLIVLIQGWLGYWLTRRLRNLTAASEQVARGDYDVHLDGSGMGEVARLAASMNAMTAAIREKIGHLEQNEEQLRLAMSAGSVVSWMRDVDDGTMQWGEGVDELFGAQPPGQSGHPDLARLVAVEDRARLNGMFDASLMTGVVQSYSVRIVRPDGAERWLAIRGKRVNAGRAGKPCLMGVARDITADKIFEDRILRLNEELEARVRERTADLEAAVKELEAFSYSVSHDLRAPLRHIGGFAAMLASANEGKLDAVSVEYLRKITAGAQRMARLIDDLLELSRVSRREVHRQPFNLTVLANQVVVGLLQDRAGKRVDISIAPEMAVEADAGLVQIVLENLLGNALKFSAGAAAPRIEVGHMTRDGETVYFVRDNGAGFDMRYAGKLFNAFERLHTREEFEGTGIGLSIVSRIVARHAGRIWAESRVGEGATFYFTLANVAAHPLRLAPVIDNAAA